jgi:hypothetical protein
MIEYGYSGQPIDWQKYMLYLKLYTLETKIFILLSSKNTAGGSMIQKNTGLPGNQEMVALHTNCICWIVE